MENIIYSSLKKVSISTAVVFYEFNKTIKLTGIRKY
jgi:hypothetical protein